MLRLYGVPLSQPFRSVAWAMLMKECPFEVVVTVPFMADKPLGSKHESYTSKTKARSDRVPMIQDGSFYLVESPAILAYLCESRGWMDLYGPPGSQRKSLIDSYMHWHHTGISGNSCSCSPIHSSGQPVRTERSRASSCSSIVETTGVELVAPERELYCRQRDIDCRSIMLRGIDTG